MAHFPFPRILLGRWRSKRQAELPKRKTRSEAPGKTAVCSQGPLQKCSWTFVDVDVNRCCSQWILGSRVVHCAHSSSSISTFHFCCSTADFQIKADIRMWVHCNKQLFLCLRANPESCMGRFWGRICEWIYTHMYMYIYRPVRKPKCPVGNTPKKALGNVSLQTSSWCQACHL